MSSEVFLAILAVVGTLVAGLGGVVLQGRQERRTWLRERRAALYVELMADAAQRQTWIEDWEWRYPEGAELDLDVERRHLLQWHMLSTPQLVVKRAEAELFGEPRMLRAWLSYVRPVQMVLFLLETGEARDAGAEAEALEGAKAVIAVGSAYGGNG